MIDNTPQIEFDFSDLTDDVLYDTYESMLTISATLTSKEQDYIRPIIHAMEEEVNYRQSQEFEDN